MMPRYPEIRVRLHSRNPFAIVSAVRLAMRKSSVDAGEIQRFSDEAMRDERPEHMRTVCSRWVQVA